MSRLGCGILGLERYEQAFRENEIHAEILPKLTANLGRVELVPHRLERAGGLDHVAFLKLGVLSCAVVTTQRGDGPRDQLGRCEQNAGT